MVGLLSMTALAADSGSHVYVGGVELTGSADEPTYATTDASGKVTTEGGSSGIATYEGDLTISGGEVTVTAPGDQINAAIDYNYVYGIYVSGNCTIAGGKVTTTVHAGYSYVTDTYGLIVLGTDGLTISGENSQPPPLENTGT